MEKEILFIISSKSGEGKKQDRLKLLLEERYQESKGVTIKITEYENHIKDLAKNWASTHGKKGLVYVCGGDGAANEVASVLCSSETSMGLIPLGTGNDFAKTLYGTQRFNEDFLKTLINKSSNPSFGKIDLLKVNGHISLNLISMGYDTLVLDQAYKNLDFSKKINKLAYPLAVVQTILKKKTYPVRYSFEDSEGNRIQGEKNALLIAMANGQYYGSGFRPAPYAKLDDGLGDFLIADSLNFPEILSLILKYRTGQHLDHNKLLYFKFESGWIESINDVEIMANYDGEIFKDKKFQFKVLKSALSFAFIN